MRLQLHDFSLAERLSLQQTVGQEFVIAPQQKVAGARHGTLDLYDVIVILAPQVTVLLGLWLTKHRLRSRTEEVAEILKEDGSTEQRRIMYSTDEAKSDPDVVGQLTAIAASPRRPAKDQKSAAGMTRSPGKKAATKPRSKLRSSK